MSDYLSYDGTRLSWYSSGTPTLEFRATSGMYLPGVTRNFQRPQFQCVRAHDDPTDVTKTAAGPIPSGLYFLQLDSRGAGSYARDDGSRTCTLRPSYSGIQKIPRGGDESLAPDGADANACEKYWRQWGRNRVRLLPADEKTRGQCGGSRGSFYLHDSTKGFTHGCIEVEPTFFTRLYGYASKHGHSRMYLRVRYRGQSTNGGTAVP